MALVNDEARMHQAVLAMGRKSVEITFFLERAKVFAETGDADKALQCLKQADDAIAKSNEQDFASFSSGVAHTTVMEDLAKAGKDDAALAMVPNLKSVLQSGPAEPEMTYPLIAAAQAAGGRHRRQGDDGQSTRPREAGNEYGRGLQRRRRSGATAG